jgi:ABC-type multidrug transport system permease subunit
MFAAVFGLVLGGAASAQTGFTGLTEAQIQAVYTAVLNQVGIWAGIVVAAIAVMFALMWILRRMNKGGGVV